MKVHQTNGTQMVQEPLTSSCEVDALFWDRDSHGLFDYDSRSLEKSTLTFNGCSLVAYDRKLRLKQALPSIEQPEEYKLALSVVFKLGNYWVFSAESLAADLSTGAEHNHYKAAWQVIKLSNLNCRKLKTMTDIKLKFWERRAPDDSVKFKEQDVVKFGRVRFRIKKLVSIGFSNPYHKSAVVPSQLDEFTEQSQFTHRETEIVVGEEELAFQTGQQLDQMVEQSKKSIVSRPVSANSQTPSCRICLSEENLKEGHELISPCECSGTLQYIGASCLKEWLDGKRQKKETPCVNSYIWIKLECEICKSPFPDSVKSKHTGDDIQLLNFNIHEGSQNYAILESVSSTNSKTIHICNFDVSACIQVGRGNQAQMRISDITVSRFHSTLVMCPDGSLAIQDNNSKFGTLKLIREPLKVNSMTHEPVYIQVGRVLMSVSSEKRFQQVRWICCPRRRPYDTEDDLHYDEVISSLPIEFTNFFTQQPAMQNCDDQASFVAVDEEQNELPSREQDNEDPSAFVRYDEEGSKLDASPRQSRKQRPPQYQELIQSTQMEVDTSVQNLIGANMLAQRKLRDLVLRQNSIDSELEVSVRDSQIVRHDAQFANTMGLVAGDTQIQPVEQPDQIN